MKKYIRSDNFKSKRSALQSVLNQLSSFKEAEGYDLQLNNQDGCIDIFDPNGVLFSRVFVDSDATAKIQRTNNEYQYVGEGNGDYIKISGTKSQKTFSDKNIRIDSLKSSISKILP